MHAQNYIRPRKPRFRALNPDQTNHAPVNPFNTRLTEPLRGDFLLTEKFSLSTHFARHISANENVSSAAHFSPSTIKTKTLRFDLAPRCVFKKLNISHSKLFPDLYQSNLIQIEAIQ